MLSSRIRVSPQIVHSLLFFFIFWITIQNCIVISLIISVLASSVRTGSVSALLIAVALCSSIKHTLGV